MALDVGSLCFSLWTDELRKVMCREKSIGMQRMKVPNGLPLGYRDPDTSLDALKKINERP